MQTIKMDFQSQSTPPVVPVMQSDSQSRFIGLTLYDGGVPYSAPSGAVYTVEYHGQGANNIGWYDTIQLSSGTRKAVIVDSASPNVVTLELAEQALRVNGEVKISLCVVNNTGYKLNTFPIICRVTGAPYVDPVSVRSYFYVTGLTSEQWMAYVTACQDAQKRAEDVAAKFVTDPTLTLSGKAADAAKVGEAINAEATRAKAAEEENAKGVSQLKEEILKINHIDGEYKYGFFNNFLVGDSIYDETNVVGNMYAVSPLVQVKSGDVLRLRTFYGSAGKYAFSDINGKIILSNSLVDSNYEKFGTWISDNVLNVPIGAKYFRFTGRKVSADTGGTIDIKDFSIVTFNRELPNEYISPSKIEIPNLIYPYNQWRDKICACLGTSLTANGGWTDIIKDRFSFSKLYNRGAGGTTLADFSGYTGIKNYPGGLNIYTDSENYNESRESVFCDSPTENSRPHEYKVGSWYSSELRIDLLPTDADLIIVDLATNDFYRSYNQTYITQEEFLRDENIKTVYGESQSPFSYDETKLFGAFMLMIKRIMLKCPKAKIVVWGMIYNSTITTENDSLTYYIKIIDKIKYLCRVTGVYFIDTMSEMSVNVWNSANIIQDGVHPYTDKFTNETGKKLVANVLTSHIQKLYPIN